MSETQQKAPYSRKLGLIVLAGLGVVTIVGSLLIALFAEDDPQAEKDKKKLEQVAKLPEGSANEADRLLEQLERDAQAAKEKRERDLQGLERQGVKRTDPPLDGPLATTIDEALLRDLDEAQREAGARPDFGGYPKLPLTETASQSGRAEAPRIAVYEEGMSEPASQAAVQERDIDERVHTLRPAQLPRWVVQQGVPIRATLLSRIDTRIEGQIVAVVTRDVRETRTSGAVVIPKGSRLVGTYETDVQPGVDRVPVRFRRLMLPDGRVVDLGDMPAAMPDGAIGVSGRYRSNFWRAVGPSFVVAAIGQWMDRRYPSRVPAQAAAGADGGGYVVQSPSVVQQVMPQVNQVVLQRYAAAKPYFVVQPGQEIRIIVTQDIEIPEGGA